MYIVEIRWLTERCLQAACPRCGADIIGIYTQAHPVKAARCLACGTQYTAEHELGELSVSLSPTKPSRFEMCYHSTP